MAVLHPIHRFPALLPRYVTRFSCIGSDCEDTCCSAGWGVYVDKKTFNAYRQGAYPELDGGLGKHLKRRRSNASDAEYARIELRSDNRSCPFLDDRLCSVQRHAGADLLSNTCFSYPRKTRNFGGQIEQALVLSCPESIRRALLEPDAFDFVTESIAVRSDTVTAVKPSHGVSLELMNETRIFCLQLMRTEELELWQRLAMAGVFCEALNKAIATGGHAGLPAMIESFLGLVQRGQLSEAIADLKPDYSLQASFFSGLWLEKTVGSFSAFQEPIMHAVAEGLGIQGAKGVLDVARLTENYARGVTNLREALQAAPHLLEHYLLNEMFNELFPFKGASVYEHYLNIVSRFGLLRLMLAAQCATGGALPDVARLVQTVQVFCRLYQHDVNFASKVNSLHKSLGSESLDKVFRFLRT